jgi:hypothetical protein
MLIFLFNNISDSTFEQEENVNDYENVDDEDDDLEILIDYDYETIPKDIPRDGTFDNVLL